MIVPFIFENEVYTKEPVPYLWIFYKFADLCLKNNIPIVAEENYFIKPSYYKKINHSATTVMDYYNITDKRLDKIESYKISNREKEKIINKYKDNFEAWTSLLSKRDKEFEELIDKIINKLEEKYEKIESFIVWNWFPSMEVIAKIHGIKIINMEGTSIRQPFYNELLTYFQFQNKYDSSNVETRYKELISYNDICYLTRKEMFALFAETENIKYLNDFNKEPIYDIGYGLGLKNDCFERAYSNINQKEVLEKLSKLTEPKKICISPHPKDPIDVEKMGFTENKLPAFSWILNCKNIVSNISNIGFEVMLAGRNLISLSDKMPTSFGKVSSLDKIINDIADEKKVNFLLFYWYVPEKLTQEYEYIKWRLSKPGIREIYNRHLDFILKERSSSLEEFNKIPNNQRLNYILKIRNIDPTILETNEQTKVKDLNAYDTDLYYYKKTIYDLRKQLEDNQQKLQKVENERNFYYNEFNKVIKSKYWKIGEPLRKIRSKKTKKEIEINLKNSIEEKYENSYKKYSVYTADYQDNINYSNQKTDIKTIAFYLPQFHTFKENDEWWGKGFTEWTNTKKSKPRFEGHYQPRVPHKDIGYYKLDNIETIKKQISLAQEHGIYGFCYYYYWFSGKRLMEKPLDLFVNNKNIDFPFCLCWANENWTRTWDGCKNDILIKQEYLENDYKKFIKDIKKYILDERYIKVDGKPMILIYNPNEIPNFKELVENWRKYAREEGIGELYICSKCDISNTEYKYTEYIDAEFDFPPQGIGHKETKITGLSSSKIFNYEKIVEDIEHLYKEHYPLKTFYYTCTMGWDNSARRKEDYTVYYNYSLRSYYKWLRIIIEETRRRNKKENRFMFINAWNEWAEGTYLEPDEKYGYANINTLSKAIFDMPFDNDKN